MNTKTLLLGAAASLALASPASAGHFQGWYVGLEAGVNMVEDIAATTITPVVAFTITEQTETGWAVLGTVGYGFQNLRIEFEAGLRTNDISEYRFVCCGTVRDRDDSVDQFTLMANVLYDIPLSPKAALTLGAGVGGDQVSFDTYPFFPFPPFNESDWAFAHQGIVGISYAVSPGQVVALTYRYLGVSGTTLDDPTAGPIAFDDITKHSLTFGVRFDLEPDAP